jgi:copper chaperone CopZ
MSEHILNKNISGLANQVASDYPHYDTSMRNQALRAVKGIMSERIQPEQEEDSIGLPDLLVNDIDETLSKYATDDVFFEKDKSSEDEEQVEEGKLPPALQAHIDAKKDKEVDDDKEVDESKDSPVRKLKEHDTIQRMQYLAGMNA